MSLFRYSDSIDVVLLVIGLIFSLGCGAGMPIFMLFFGDFFNASEASSVFIFKIHLV